MDREPGREALRVATLGVGDALAVEDDEAGERLRAMLADAGFALSPHAIVADAPGELRRAIDEACDAGADAIVTTGGTGISPREGAYEAVSELLERTIDGFGEAFRRIAWDEMGPRAILSRAVAGTYRGRVVAALPGGPKAVELAVDRILVAVLPHAVALARGAARHRHPRGG